MKWALSAIFLVLSFTCLPLAAQENGQALGLTNVKRFVEVLGDRLWVESEKGLGAIFFFNLAQNWPLDRAIYV